MGTRPRDSQRSRVYAAERQAFPNIYSGPDDDLSTVAQTMKWLRMVLFWSEETAGMFPNAVDRIDQILVTEGRCVKRAYGGIHYQFKPYGIETVAVIRSPRHMRTKPTMLHELAHCIVEIEWPNRAWHGPAFCSTYIYLVGIGMDSSDADVLLDAFHDGKVHMTDYHMRGAEEWHLEQISLGIKE